MNRNNDGSKPWDRLPDETPKAWFAFVTYRNLGPSRTNKEVARILYGHECRRVIERWTGPYKWQERAAAYDEYLSAMAEQETSNKIKEMAKRHAALATNFQAKVVERLQSLDASKLTHSDAIKYLEVATRIERTAYDMPVDTKKILAETFSQDIAKPSTNQEYDLTVLNDEELEQLKQFIARIRRK